METQIDYFILYHVHVIFFPSLLGELFNIEYWVFFLYSTH